MMVSNAWRSQCELRLLNCFVSRVLRTQQGISAQIYLERNSITPVGSLRSSGGLPEPRRMRQPIIILRNTADDSRHGQSRNLWTPPTSPACIQGSALPTNSRLPRISTGRLIFQHSPANNKIKSKKGTL